MSQRKTGKMESKTVRGYIVQVPDKRDGSDEEDEEDEDNWLDYSQIKNAFTDGAFVKQQKKPRYGKVSLGDLDHPKQTHSCFGRFVVLDPWWEMTVTVDNNNRVEGLTQYRVRQDREGIVGHNLVPLLLNTTLRRCFGAEGAKRYMRQLEQFMSTHNKQKLIFEDIEPLLYQFTQAHPEEKKTISQVRYHDCVQAVLRGLRYPDLLCFLCRLFPLTFLSCLLTPVETTLAALEQAAHNEPWVFGFKAILASRFKVYGMEAGYRAFEGCSLMDSLPQVQRDALYIYEVLKTDASRNGHTYISFHSLCQHRHWADLRHQVDDWTSALTFLTHNGVTVEERFDSGRNLFLYHNWKSEVDIASGLNVVMTRAIEAQKPPWDVDFTSPDLRRLQGDDDQWTAAQKVAGSPVCIMSGKGGCGKTTVVTQLVQHICRTTAVTEGHAPEDKDMDDLMLNPEHPNTGPGPQSSEGNKKASSGQPPPPPPQVTEEQLKQIIQTATRALKHSQAQQGTSQEKRKLNQIQVELTSDLIKYLGTTGDTALSRTPNGRKILLTAPTGKAAKLLGHKAKMESFTLHRIIFSYRAFVKQQQQQQRDKQKGGEQGTGEGEDGHEEDLEGSQTSDKGEDTAASDSGKTSKQGSSSGTGDRGEDTSANHSRKMSKQNSSSETGDRGEDTAASHSGKTSIQRSSSETGDSQRGSPSKQRSPGKTATPADNNTNTTTNNNSSEGDADYDDDEGDDDNADVPAPTWKHAKTEVLVVDECSLVSLRLFATLLTILTENTPLCKVVLLGDVRQLPSIQPGNFLGDVFAAFRDRGLGVELRTNHRSESELIVRNAARIARQQLPVIDPAKHFHFLASEDSRDSADPERDAAVRTLLVDRPELLAHQTSQFVAFRRIDCDAINELCCMHYNQHTTREAKSSGSSKQPYDFRVGDKICFRKNGQVLNHGQRLRGYLQSHPDILQAFGISAKEKNPQKNKKATMDATAAAEQILNSIGDEEAENDGSQRSVSIEQEKPWGHDGHMDHPDCSDRADYHVQTTDFGMTMTRQRTQFRAAADGRSTPSALGSQLRLEDTGVEDSVVGGQGSSQDNTLPCLGQDNKEDGEERAGKLKNGEVRLCNGEVFFIMDDVTEMEENEGSSKESRYLTLSDRDPECPRVVCASYRALKRECRLCHSWARTIHTYQGSESDTVVYYVGESRVQNWKHVYTAVTRGRKSVVLVGKESELRQAVWRGDRPRRSRLARRLNDAMKDLAFTDLHAIMRAINERARVALLSTLQPPPPPPPLPPPTSHPWTDASSLTPRPSGHEAPSPSAIDAFPDSDDSWVRDMSPVWAADYQPKTSSSGVTCKTPEASTNNAAATTAAEMNGFDSPDLYDRDVDWDLLSPLMEGQNEEESGLELTPRKRQGLQEQDTEMTSANKEASQEWTRNATPRKRQGLQEQDTEMTSANKEVLQEWTRNATPRKRQGLQEQDTEMTSANKEGSQEWRKVTPKKMQRLQGQNMETTPPKKCLLEQESEATPKKRLQNLKKAGDGLCDPIDSIVSPVRRTLNI